MGSVKWVRLHVVSLIASILSPGINECVCGHDGAGIEEKNRIKRSLKYFFIYVKNKSSESGMMRRGKKKSYLRLKLKMKPYGDINYAF